MDKEEMFKKSARFKKREGVAEEGRDLADKRKLEEEEKRERMVARRREAEMCVRR